MAILDAFFCRKKKNKPPRCKFLLDSACISHMGYVRGNNEDNFYYCGRCEGIEHSSMEEPYSMKVGTEESQTFAVFDGMGGEQAGEVASYAAARALSMEPVEDLSEQGLCGLLRALNRKVCKAADEGKFRQIGTTATVLVFRRGKAHLANVGDSPAFLFRNGALRLISEKHTDEALLKQYHIQGRKPQLTQFLGVSESEMLLEPYVKEMDVEEGDLFLLCSDGLTDLLPEDEIGGILKEKQQMAQAAVQLCHAALARGGADNITLILCKAVLE